MEKEVITYQDRKEDVYSWMNAQNPDVNPISYGSSYVFSELWDADDIMLCEYFIACSLFELEHNDLETHVEEKITYWIYQFKRGLFNDEIPDIEIMQKDIEKLNQ